MKTTNIFVSVFFSITLLVDPLFIAHAEQCFPNGSITVTTSNGKTLDAYVDSMGKITIYNYKDSYDYSNGNGGTLSGSVDTLGNFSASNNFVTVRGSVDTTCKTKSPSINTINIKPSSDAELIGEDAANNLHCIQQFGSWSSYDKSSKKCVDNKESDLTMVCQRDSMLGPNSHYDLSSEKCTCDTNFNIYYDDSLKKVRCVLPVISLEESEKIKKSAQEILSSYYPEITTILSNSAELYSRNSLPYPNALPESEKRLRSALDQISALKATYANRSLDKDTNTIVYSLTTTTGICLLTAQIIISNGSLDTLNNASKKCTGWADTTKNLTSPSNLKKDMASNYQKANPTLNRILKKGMSGEDVKQLQVLLQKLDYLPSTHVPSTYFGTITSNALIKFQKDNKIKPTNGFFGPTTQAKLISLPI